MLNFINICKVGAKLYHADGQTDKMKLIVSFLNLTSAPKSYSEESDFIELGNILSGLFTCFYG